MNNGYSSKRTIPSSPKRVKRAKTEESDSIINSYIPCPLPLTATHGVERIPLPASAKVNHLTSEYLQQVTCERTEILSRQGRRVVGLPVILNDGIVMHWVRVKLDSSQFCDASDASGLRSSQKDDSKPFSVNIAPKEESDKNFRVSVAPITSGSGTTAGDAIIIDADEGRSENACASRDGVQRVAPSNLGFSSHRQDANNHSDSDIEFISWTQHDRPGDKVEDHLNNFISSYRTVTPGLQPEGPPRTMPVDPPHGPAAQSNRDDAAAALCGEWATLHSDDTEVATPDLEDHGTNRNVDDDEDTDIVQRDTNLTRPLSQGSAVRPGSSRIVSRPQRPTPLPSLEPIRDLLVRTRRERGSLSRYPERTPPSKRPAVAKTMPLRNRTRRDSAESADSSTSSDSDEDLNSEPSEAPLRRVPLPKTNYGRSRRLLMPESMHLPFVAVTMRGDCHFIERKKKFRITGYSLPNPGVFRHVEDACIIGDTVVLGCDKGPHQISFLPVSAANGRCCAVPA
ncbi:hypothetical protein BS17DRAFT_218538 [Gyrodon lividus]|nr:hypothetical protein BS17DRAFT_218538 [Gyrodon lividus]